MDEILRQVPHSVEAEQSVLGSMLIDERCAPEVIERLRPEDFYLRQNRALYQSLCALFASSRAIDLVTVMEQMRRSGQYNDVREYVCQLMEITPTAANVRVYVDIVQEMASIRAAQTAAQEAVRLAAEGAGLDEVQAALQTAQEAITERQVTTSVNLSGATLELYAALEERQKRGGAIAGITTGFNRLDEMTGGLHAGNMAVIAARSGMGKSAFALNLATSAARSIGEPVLFFSLEMTSAELIERVYSANADVDFGAIRSARLHEHDWTKLANATTEITGLNLRIVEAPSLDMDEIAFICRREKPALVIVDHIGLIRPSGKHRDRREAMDVISRRIKCLAKERGVPVVAVAQLNRAIMGRVNKTPMLSDLRESGSIEQDADAVFFVDRPAYYDRGKDKNTANLVVAKNRHGVTGTVPLLWFGARQKFTDDWTEEETRDDD